MKKRSLAFKLVSGGIAAVLIPLLVVGLFSVIRSSGALTILAREQATNVAANLAAMTRLVLAQELKSTDQLALGNLAVEAASLETDADPSAAQTDSRTAFGQYLERIMAANGMYYETILLADAKGIVTADGNGGTNRGMSIAERSYFREAMKGRANIGHPVESKLSGLPVLPVCAPIRGADGRVLGALTTVLKIQFLTDNITSVQVGATGYPFMVDDAGLVIAHPNTGHILKTNLAKTGGMEAIMSRMLAGDRGVEAYVFEGMDKISGFAPVELTGWSIGVTQPAAEFLRAANEIRNVILLVGGVFLAVTVLAILFFARSITLPIMRAVREITGGAEQVAAASSQVSGASQSLAEGASGTGRIHRRDVLLPGRDVLHDPPECGQCKPGQHLDERGRRGGENGRPRHEGVGRIHDGDQHGERRDTEDYQDH